MGAPLTHFADTLQVRVWLLPLLHQCYRCSIIRKFDDVVTEILFSVCHRCGQGHLLSNTHTHTHTHTQIVKVGTKVDDITVSAIKALQKKRFINHFKASI